MQAAIDSATDRVSRHADLQTIAARPLRIAVWHNLPSGGGKRALFSQVKGLVAAGHHVEAWCPPSADQAFLPLSELVQEHVVPCAEIGWRPIRSRGLRRRLLANYRYTAHKIEALDAHCQQCAREINQAQFDVLLAHPCMHLRVPAIGRYVNWPRVLYLQEPNRQLYEARIRVPWAALDLPDGFWRTPRLLYRFVRNALDVHALRRQAREEWRSARAFDLILVNSHYSRESVLRAYDLEARVCRLGVDAEHFRPAAVAREPFVVSVGSMHPQKGPERAVRALATIASAHRPEIVWIANQVSPDYHKYVKRLALAMGVHLSVHVGVSESDVINWLSRATAMIYTPRLEPFGFAPLEANACETPVVAVAEGGLRETIRSGENGVLVDDGDPAALGAAVLRLLQEPALARALGEAGRRLVVERWQWSAAVRQLEQYLEHVVESH